LCTQHNEQWSAQWVCVRTTVKSEPQCGRWLVLADGCGVGNAPQRMQVILTRDHALCALVQEWPATTPPSPGLSLMPL
jgi:hypothetical protein